MAAPLPLNSIIRNSSQVIPTKQHLDNAAYLDTSNYTTHGTAYDKTIRSKRMDMSYNLACYYAIPFDNSNKFLQPAHIDAALCTHLIVASAVVQSNSVYFRSSFDKQILRQVVKLREKNPDLKVLLSIIHFSNGSPSNEGFPGVVANIENLQKFVNSVVSVISEFHLDGIDIDWEFPSWPLFNLEEKYGFSKLLEFLRYRLPHSLLTAAVAAPINIARKAYEIYSIASHVDFMNIMAYGYNYYHWSSPLTGPNAPLYSSLQETGNIEDLDVSSSIQYYISMGVPKYKILLGMTAYGRSFKLINEDVHGFYSPVSGTGIGTDGYLTFLQTCEFISNSHVSTAFDDDTKTPYSYYKKDWISYDNQLSLALKAEYANSLDLGGAMVFVIAVCICAALARPEVAKSETMAAPLPLNSIIRNSSQVIPTKQHLDNAAYLDTSNYTTHGTAYDKTIRSKRMDMSYNLACYYAIPFDNSNKFLQPAHIDAALCTHLIVASAVVQSNSVYFRSSFDKQILRQVVKLREKNPDLKVLLSIIHFSNGSPSNEGFPGVVANIENLQKFVNSVVSVISEFHLDGIDIDWEFPSWPLFNLEEKYGFSKLLEFLRYRLPHSLLTAAVAAPINIARKAYEIYSIASHVDFMNIMAYGYNYYHWSSPLTGPNAPLYSSLQETGNIEDLDVSSSIQYYISMGVPKYKILLGMTAYGRSFKLINEDVHGFYSPVSGTGIGTDGYLTFLQTCEFISNSHVSTAFDDDTKTPYSYYKKDWISYDNQLSLALKAEYANSLDLGGAMVFSLNGDDYSASNLDIAAYLDTSNYTTHGTSNDKTIRSKRMDMSYKLACYYAIPIDNTNKFLQPAHIDAALCTHLIVASAVVQSNSIYFRSSFDRQILRQVVKLREKNPDLKVFLSIIDFSDDSPSNEGFPGVVANIENLQKFVNSVVSVVRKFHLDGIDIDWEFPSWPLFNLEEKYGFSKLLEFLSYNLPDSLLSASVAGPISIIKNSYEIHSLANYVDFINVMAFDFEYHHLSFPLTGPNAPLFSSQQETENVEDLDVSSSIQYYISMGVPKYKILLGMTTYGRSYKLINKDVHGFYSPVSGPGIGLDVGYLTYFQTCNFISSINVSTVFDDDTKTPYSYYKNDWISYDNPLSLALKAEYANSLDLGGVMLFSLNADDYNASSICSSSVFPLTTIIKKALNNKFSLH
ncbi:hypothetical protein ACI65C_005273 [Semiaphis heraclei]